jgi:uncharacterized ion transporter superfamily protein YfcC
MWWNIIPTVFKIGADIYKNNKQSELLESEAERRYYERMARGEIEYQRDVADQQDKSWKDEFVLIVVCIPIIVLSYAVISDDINIKAKLDLFFDYFGKFPSWYQWLIVGIFGAIYGLKPSIDAFTSSKK